MSKNFKEAFEKTKVAGSIAAGALDEVNKIIKPGISTEQIDKLCYEYINDHGAYSAPLYYRGFPKSICTSVNHQICHGIPSDTKRPANQMVPVVPMFAPSTAATAAGRGTAPDATSAMMAVVESEDDCQSRVITIPPRNIQ